MPAMADFYSELTCTGDQPDEYQQALRALTRVQLVQLATLQEDPGWEPWPAVAAR